MALRVLRCDGRVPRKSRYSRSGKPPLPDQCSRGRDRGFPEERSGLFSHPSSLTGSRQGNAGKNVRDNGSPRGSPRAPTNVRGGATGGFQRSNWDAPAGIMGRAVQKCPDARRPKSRAAGRTLSYVERSGMRATQQTPFFNSLLIVRVCSLPGTSTASAASTPPGSPSAPSPAGAGPSRCWACGCRCPGIPCRRSPPRASR